MSTDVNNNTRDTKDNYKFIRAVEEAFFLLDRDHNRSVNSDDLCAVAKSVGKRTKDYFLFLSTFAFSFRYRIRFE